MVKHAETSVGNNKKIDVLLWSAADNKYHILFVGNKSNFWMEQNTQTEV